MDLPFLPTLNACLNGLAFVLLITGIAQIKRGREEAHKKLMIGALAVSTLFLISYLTHHYTVGLTVKYAGPEWGRTPYLTMLLAHTILAAAVPFLAIRTAYLGFKERRETHRKWAKVTAPIWIFVSITGVLIYFVLYLWTDSYAEAMNAQG
jgi:uncharacterized membrane protein YozB (DUF420 family)